MSHVNLQLYDSVPANNGLIGDYTQPFAPTWRRSIASIGGFKLGTVDLTTNELSPAEMRELFTFGLMREIREYAGGSETWRGFITAMEWTHRGDIYVLDMANVVNARRAFYRRIFDSLLTNGSAESGAWTAKNGATVTQSTDWLTDGQYSCLITVADNVQRGAIIQSSVTISDGIAYECTADLNVVSGHWKLKARRTDNGEVIALFDTGGSTGVMTAHFTIQEANTYAGTISIELETVAADGPGQVYADGVKFKRADLPTATGWHTNAESILVFGRREQIDLWGGLSASAAYNRIRADLIKSFWPKTDIVSSNSTRQRSVSDREDRLSIVFGGYWLTLNWLYTTLLGSQSASSTVAALAALQSQFISIGRIENNTMTYTLEDTSPLRCGDVLREICEAGDEAGNKWQIGVYADRKLYYEAVPFQLSYHLRAGHLLYAGGGDVEPWRARPGWAYIDDLPLGPTPITAAQQFQNLRWRYLNELEMMPADDDHPDGPWLQYQREDLNA